MRLRILLGLTVLAGVWWFVVRPGGVAAVKTSPNSGAAGPKTVVVFSPGHGWWSTDTQAIDPGATGSGLTEKDVALDVAEQAQRLLDRCPVQARLTRAGDDKEHTLANVHELVNAQQPALAVAVHIADVDAPSGALAWYTVGGRDDGASQRLAETLAAAVSERLGLPDLGAQPETSSPNGGLYIHPWQAPAVLVELGSLGADGAALRTRRAEFGRALAQGVLAYLGLPGDCADGALPQGAAGLVAVSFPDEPVSLNLTLTNDGLGGWGPEQYRLVSVGE
ncbi:MAG: N-acetylmuramoyl-L-alanine amidase, partial [Anaerolineales bacterium]